MKETAWRTILQKQFREHWGEKGFIWAMEARAKRGYPDLDVKTAEGFEQHFELKVAPTVPSDIRKLFHPCQVETLRRMVSVGLPVWGLVRLELRSGILRYLLVTPHPTDSWDFRILDKDEFRRRWLTQDFTSTAVPTI